MPTPTPGPAKGFTVTFDDAEMQRALAKVKDWTLKKTTEVQKVINRTAILVESGAKQRCPVGVYKDAEGNSIDGRVGGRLRSSIKAKTVSYLSNRMTAEVSTPVEYAAFVEFGTGRRGSESGVTPPSGYDYGGVGGMRARPFLMPAAESQKARYTADLKKALNIL